MQDTLNESVHYEDERKISFPLSNDDIQYLYPKLYSLAGRFSKCKSFRDDLVQAALLALIDGKRKWKNYVVVSQSAMKDYIRTERRAKFPVSENNYQNRVDVEDVMIDQLQQEEIVGFKGLGLEETLRHAAVMYWVDGKTQEAIASRLGVAPTTISNYLKEVKNVIKEKWLSPSVMKS